MPLTTQAPTIIDISVPISDSLTTWPSDPGVSCCQTHSIQQGDVANVSALHAGVHTGTHVDAFHHFLPKGQALHQMPLDPWIGPCRVIEIEHEQCITQVELEPYQPQKGERLIFKTRNSQSPWYQEPFNQQFIYIQPQAAQYLAQCGVQLVGIDYLSVEQFGAEGAPTHHALLNAGIYIIEGLYLNTVTPGPYELIALPLSLAGPVGTQGADGAPCRAVLRPVCSESSPSTI